jgi:predicted PurR-regulated permease PerM
MVSLVAIATILFFLASRLFIHTVSSILTALVLAYLLNPLLGMMEKKGLRRVPALILLFSLLTILVSILSVLLLPLIGQELVALVAVLPDYAGRLSATMAAGIDSFSPAYRSEEGVWLLAQFNAARERLTLELSFLGYDQLERVLYGVFNVLLAPVIAIFMLYYKDQVRRWLIHTLPETEGCGWEELGRRIDRALQQFIFAISIDFVVASTLATAALSLLRVPFAPLWGLLAGVASWVPVVGVVVAALPPLFIVYLTSGSPFALALVIVLYTLILVVIERDLVAPFIARGARRLNPLAVIFAVMAMGEFMGFWGVVLAVPFLALIRICAAEARQAFDLKE